MAIAFVNKTTGSSLSGVTNYNCTAASHTTGNAIVLGVKYEGGTTTVTVTDTAGNTYRPRTRRDHSNGDLHGQIFDAKNITGNASNVLNIAYGAARSFGHTIIHQYSGLDTTEPFDQENFGQGTGTALSTSNVTTTSNDEVLVAFACEYNAENYTPGTNFTERHDFAGAGGISGASEDRIVSSTGTYNASMTQDLSDAWVLTLATYKMAGGGGGGTNIIINRGKEGGFARPFWSGFRALALPKKKPLWRPELIHG